METAVIYPWWTYSERCSRSGNGGLSKAIATGEASGSAGGRWTESTEADTWKSQMRYILEGYVSQILTGLQIIA